MHCLNPKIAWQSKSKCERTGRRLPTFNRRDAYVDLPPFELPCGYCDNCLASRKVQWGVRIYHESTLHEQCCFSSWTYDEDHLPDTMSQVADDFSAMMKRLRFAVEPVKLRFLMVAERGEKSGRLHAHAAIFGADFRGGAIQLNSRSWTNEIASKAWKAGNIQFDDLTPASAMYIAGYCLKKSVAGHEVVRRQSNRPGIGHGWMDDYADNIRRTGFVVIGGRKYPVPVRYFDWAEDGFEALKTKRYEYGLEQAKVPKHIRQQRAEAKRDYLHSLMEISAARKTAVNLPVRKPRV